MTIVAPVASGYTVNACMKNGTDTATLAQPNQAAPALRVTRYAVRHTSHVPQADSSARNAMTPRYPAAANTGRTSTGRPGA